MLSYRWTQALLRQQEDRRPRPGLKTWAHHSILPVRFAVFAVISFPFFLLHCSSSFHRHPDLNTVEEVNLTHYLGTWREQYRIPNSFQDGSEPCYDTTATYRRRKDGKIIVQNECLRAGKKDEAVGLAYVVDGSGNAKLKVNFTGLWILRALGIGDGNYWILALGPMKENQYSWALVGEPTREYGWILSRAPLDSRTADEILGMAVQQGYSKDQFRSFLSK